MIDQTHLNREPRSVIRGATPKTTPNNKGIGTHTEPEYKRVVPIIDWYRSTGSDRTFDEAVHWAKGLHFDEFTGELEPYETGRGILGYAVGLYWGENKGGFKLTSQGNCDTMMIDVPGGELSRYDLDDQVDLIRQSFEVGFNNPTRLDLALDIHAREGQTLTIIDEAIESAARQEIASPRNVDPREPKTNNGEYLGHSLNLGAREGSAYVRIYDKGLQTKLEDKGKWIRWEVEFKSDKATEAARMLLAAPVEQSAEVLKGIVLGSVELKPAWDADSSHEAEPMPNWLERLREGTKLHKVRPKRATRTYDGMVDNLLRTYGRRISNLSYMTGLSPGEIAQRIFGGVTPKAPTRMDDVLRQGQIHLTTHETGC